MTVALTSPVATDTPVFNATLSCTCRDDVDLADMLALTAAGLDQWTASKIIWGESPAWDAPPVAWSAWIRRYVTDLGRDARRAIGLPLATGAGS